MYRYYIDVSSSTIGKSKHPGESIHTLQGTMEKDGQKKKTRKRKRHLYNSIRQQMEFYFGDSNLQKDRFMKQLIEKDPYVPLEVFLTFNKIKSLTDSVDMIAMALSSSELLELDETKKKVHRKTALNPDENVDDRTLYVEALPVNVDHEWMSNMFKRFGKVTYVSLPKYAKSRKPKDFGFVEFQKEKSVLKALKAFKAFNGVLCTETTDPAHLASIKAHNANEESEKMETEKKATKRTLPADRDVQSKRPKLEVLEDNAPSGEEHFSKESLASSSSESDLNAKENSEEVKKKRRKHKNSAEKRKKQLELTTDASFYELKILPKREWKRLRNRYLNLQREKTSELKRNAARERQQQLAKENAASNSTSEVGMIQPPVKKSKHEERKMHKMKMNFYGAGADAEPPVKQAVSKNVKTNAGSKVSIKFEHGLIVEVGFDKPCVDIKEFKSEMRKHKSVKYVDVDEGAMAAFVRFETAAAADSFVKKTASAERKYSILKGKSEIVYFEKIERDRQMKLNKEIKVPSKRGREKVKASLAKHIWFNDEEAE